jgi:SAM-dependent methyltransferase
MTPGQIARRLLGPAADPVIRRYRRFYVDLAAWGEGLAGMGGVESVLEVGCGDGHMCEVLARVFPGASILGIDIADEPGRLYAGRDEGVEFRRAAIDELTGRFDLVVMCDVLHHVPVAERPGLCTAAWQLVAPGGSLAVKDWVSGKDLATGLAYLSDRFVTGDRPGFFHTDSELLGLVTTGAPGGRVVDEGWVRPRRNNRYLVVGKPA